MHYLIAGLVALVAFLLWPLWRLEAEEEPPFLTAPPGRGS